jgi:hypothetical protein
MNRGKSCKIGLHDAHGHIHLVHIPLEVLDRERKKFFADLYAGKAYYAEHYGVGQRSIEQADGCGR